MRVAWIGLLLCCLFTSGVQAQSKISLALFNLTPESIDAIGMDGDLLFSMRQELERSSVLQLMSRRQMEEGLYRINGSQVSDTSSVITFGAGLGVNYILTGTMNVVPGTIQVKFKLVDVVNRTEVDNWQETFKTNIELVSKAASIARKLEQKLVSIGDAPVQAETSTAKIIDFNAVDSNGNVVLSWTKSIADNAFYYNLYRGASESGPFEFVGSATESKYQDTTISESGRYFYRVGIILESGEEISGGVIASTSVSKMRNSRDVSPPSILSHDAYVNGVALNFVPSVANKGRIKGFNLYRKQSQKPWELVTFIKDENKISYTVTYVNALAPNTVYEFALSTVNRGDLESPMSQSVSIETPANVVLDNDKLVLTRQVNINWQPRNDDLSIRFYRRLVGENDWQTIGEVKDQSRSKFIDTKGLDDGKDYQYSATVFDSKSESTKSNIITASTKLLSAPQSLTAEMGVKSATLNWDAVEDEDAVAYRIYRKEGDLSQQDMLDEVAVIKGRDNTTFIDGVTNTTPLKDGTEYHYVVAALNEYNGVGKVSKTVSVATKPRPKVLSAPSVVVNESDISVSWQAADEEDIGKYIVLRSWNNEPWTKAAEVDANQLSYIDTNLKAYAMTHYKVVAQDVDGLQSPESEVVSRQSPLQITLAVHKEDLLRKVELSWNQQRNYSGINVYRRTSQTEQWTKVGTVNTITSQSYVDHDPKRLREGLSYDYALSAFDSTGESPLSNIVSARTKGLPQPPQSFGALGDQVKQVPLTWQANEDTDVKGYKVYRLEPSGELDLLETTSSRTVTSYLDEGSFFKKLENGVNYTYRISSINLHDVEGPLSSTITARTKPVPLPVEALSANENAGTVNLQWQPSAQPDIRYYQVYRGSSCSSVRKLNRSTSQSFTDSGTSAGKTYCYRVTAIDVAGLEGNYSAPAQITLAPQSEGGF